MDRGPAEREEGGGGGDGRKAANAASMAKSTSGAAKSDGSHEKETGKQIDNQQNNVEEKNT